MSNRIAVMPREIAVGVEVGDIVEVRGVPHRVIGVDKKAGIRLDNGSRVGISRLS